MLDWKGSFSIREVADMSIVVEIMAIEVETLPGGLCNHHPSNHHHLWITYGSVKKNEVAKISSKVLT